MEHGEMPMDEGEARAEMQADADTLEYQRRFEELKAELFTYPWQDVVQLLLEAKIGLEEYEKRERYIAKVFADVLLASQAISQAKATYHATPPERRTDPNWLLIAQCVADAHEHMSEVRDVAEGLQGGADGR